MCRELVPGWFLTLPLITKYVCFSCRWDHHWSDCYSLSVWAAGGSSYNCFFVALSLAESHHMFISRCWFFVPGVPWDRCSPSPLPGRARAAVAVQRCRASSRQHWADLHHVDRGGEVEISSTVKLEVTSTWIWVMWWRILEACWGLQLLLQVQVFACCVLLGFAAVDIAVPSAVLLHLNEIISINGFLFNLHLPGICSGFLEKHLIPP